MSHEIIWYPHGVVSRRSGFVSSADMADGLNQIQGDPRFDELLYQISDYTGVTDFDVTNEAIDLVAASVIGASFLRPQACVACVATGDRVAQACQRYIDLVARPDRMKLFSTVNEACDWIFSMVGIRPPLN